MYEIKPFDVIAGSSVGGWSDRAMCFAMINYLDAVNTAAFDQTGRACDDDKVIELFSELAIDTDDNIDVEYYERETADLLDHLLPDYCYIAFHDNELTVLPAVEAASEEFDPVEEIPEHGSDDFYLVVNDHGNTTLYRKQFTGSITFEYVEVWSVV